ncbi:hypothetical protein, partial [Aestuariivirga sp.]|uniref:hypothetical protein n=1 Tax=Aestuariivirga sp. TaxID=2650926 RepID=UPI0025C60C29
ADAGARDHRDPVDPVATHDSSFGGPFRHNKSATGRCRLDLSQSLRQQDRDNNKKALAACVFRVLVGRVSA